MARTGVFVTLEGIDGCGKSTQASLLVEALQSLEVEVVSLREPGGTAISEKIRTLLLDPANAEMVPECELLLYEASRAQLVRQIIQPALERGSVVVCDRFYDSTYGYQHGGRMLDEELVNMCNALGSCGCVPARTLVLDLSPEVALARATRGGADRLEAEGMAFQQRIREAYMRLATKEPSRVHIIDAEGAPGKVFERIASDLSDLLPVLRGEGAV